MAGKRPRIVYGKTVWGQQWLNALKRIDTKGQVAKGKRFANKGWVQALSLDGTTVSARVKETEFDTWQNYITPSRFSEQERQQILETITGDPVIVAAVADGRLPEELYDRLVQTDIKLFPGRWEALGASCNCRERVIPCKHLTAVFYRMAREIDENPLLIFSMRGMDLPKELEEFGNTLLEEQAPAVPLLEQLFSLEVPPDDLEAAPGTVKRPDFTLVPDNTLQVLFSLLPDAPGFCPDRNIKNELYESLAYVAGQNQELLKLPLEITANPFARNQKSFRLLFNRDLDFLSIEFLPEDAPSYHSGFEVLNDLIICLQNLRPAMLPNYHPAVTGLYHAYQLALHLSVKGGCLPEALQIDDESWTIRWVPAMVVPEVAQLFNQVKELLPPGAVCLQKGRAKFYSRGDEPLKALVSLFLNRLVSHGLHSELPKLKQKLLAETWYLHEAAALETPEDTDTMKAVAAWLYNCRPLQARYLPLIKIAIKEEVSQNRVDFLLSFFLQNRKNPGQEPVSLQDLLQKDEYQPLRQFAEPVFDKLFKLFPVLSGAMANQATEPLVLNSEQFARVYSMVLPPLRLLQIKTRMPKNLHHVVSPRLSGYLQLNKTVTSSAELPHIWRNLQLQWRVDLGTELLTPKEFSSKINGRRGILKINEQFIWLQDDRLNELNSLLRTKPRLKENELLMAVVAKEYQGYRLNLGANAAELRKRLLSPEPVELPEALQTELRPYQKMGLDWLCKNARFGFGGIIADDVGLGKTLQLIAFLLKQKEEGKLNGQPALVVAAGAMLANWQRQFERAAPVLAVRDTTNGDKITTFANTDVVLATSGYIKKEQKLFKKQDWHVLVLAEEPVTGTMSVLKPLKTSLKIALTDVPPENHMSTYFGLFEMVYKGYLGSLVSFRKNFVKPVDLSGDDEQLGLFNKITAPFVLRREKDEEYILKELPENPQATITCRPSAGQKQIYQRVFEQHLSQIKKQKDEDGRARAIYTMQLALQQICTHPAQYLGKEAVPAEGSGKIELLFELLRRFYTSGEKTIVFTRSRQTGNLLSELVASMFKVQPLWLLEETPADEKDKLLNDFVEKPWLKIMLVTWQQNLPAIEYTTADHLVHFDLFWNPAVQQQHSEMACCTDDRQATFLYRLVTTGTFEEKLYQALQQPGFADMKASVGERWLDTLSDEQLEELFKLN